MTTGNKHSSNPAPGNAASFGRDLRAIRLEKGLDLKTISKETRIAVNTLNLLENEDHHQLPDEVFVKGFIKSYAEAVEVKADDIIQRYLASRHHFLQATRYEADLIKAGDTFWRRLFLAFAAFICLVIVSVVTLEKPDVTETRHGQSAPPKMVRQSTPPRPENVSVNTEPKSIRPEEMSLKLGITAVSKTWLKVIVDGQKPKEYTLNPEDHLELKGAIGFNLLIGNATGIQLQLNETPVVVEGKKGQVVTLKLP